MLAVKGVLLNSVVGEHTKLLPKFKNYYLKYCNGVITFTIDGEDIDFPVGSTISLSCEEFVSSSTVAIKNAVVGGGSAFKYGDIDTEYEIICSNTEIGPIDNKIFSGTRTVEYDLIDSASKIVSAEQYRVGIFVQELNGTIEYSSDAGFSFGGGFGVGGNFSLDGFNGALYAVCDAGLTGKVRVTEYMRYARSSGGGVPPS